MTVLRFLGLLFVFIGVLASSSVAIALLVLMLRFWPATLIALLALYLFSWILKQLNFQHTRPS